VGAVQVAFSAFLYLLGCLVLGLALYPGVLFTWWLLQASAGQPWELRALGVALGVGTGYFLYGFTLLAITVALRYLLGLSLAPGEHPYFSLMAFRWVLASSLNVVVKSTFMDFLALSPLLNTYLRLMGARLGKGVLINSKYVHDWSLLEIGDGAVIGGDAVISCHVAERGKILLAPVRIGKGALIGQRAVIMPGAEVGDGAVVGAQALVLKGQKIPAGEVWVGIPARRLEPGQPA
jgi:non-ribosomal peptide synthetase-like protein